MFEVFVITKIQAAKATGLPPEDVLLLTPKQEAQFHLLKQNRITILLPPHRITLQTVLKVLQ